MGDIVRCFTPGKGQQVIAGGDPLGDLPQFSGSKLITQFRLSYQKDLQQFVSMGFQIGQQADLLQYIRAEILSLVNQKHRPPDPRMRFQQIPVELCHQFTRRFGSDGDRDAELLANGI